MTEPFHLLRDALWQLGLEADEQRRELSGTVVPDELALDLANAVESIEYAQKSAGLRLTEDVFADLERLSALFDASPGDPFWADESLDHHPTWAEARRRARAILPRLPST